MKTETISRLSITARYAETDMMGVIHHSVYPVWFEAGRTELIHKLGMRYSDMEKSGLMLPLAKLSCSYHRPVQYEDTVTVETRIHQVTAARIEFCYRVLLEGEVMAEGSTVHGFVSSETFLPMNLKKTRPEWFEMFKTMENDRWESYGSTSAIPQ